MVVHMKKRNNKNNKTLKYIPSVANLMRKTATKTRRVDFFDCKKDQIKVKKISKKGKITFKCAKSTSKEGMEQLIRVMNRPRVAQCVTAPKQMLSNCWFNTMFMSMFISDKGLHFSKPARQVMITGTRLNGTKIHKSFRNVFSKLNMAIQASVDCNQDNFYLLKDTNSIIKDIYNNLKNERRYKEEFSDDVQNAGEYGNPIGYYTFLMDYLFEGNNSHKRIDDFSLSRIRNIQAKPVKEQNLERRDAIFVVIDFEEQSFRDWYKSSKQKKTLTMKIGSSTYVCDSMIISNEEHFISFHTINGKEYGFDGATNSILQPFKWKKDINKNRDFNLDKNRGVKNWSFNFMKGYQMMIFFRTT